MATKSARTIGGGVGFGLLLTNMKKLLVVFLFIALIVSFYFVDQTQAQRPTPPTEIEVLRQEMEDLLERIAELEQELGNFKRDYQEARND